MLLVLLPAQKATAAPVATVMVPINSGLMVVDRTRRILKRACMASI